MRGTMSRRRLFVSQLLIMDWTYVPIGANSAVALYRCLPLDSRLPFLIEAYNTSRSFVEDIVSDLSVCWKEVTYVCSVALVVSLVILVLLRFLANFIIWVTLVALCLTAVTASAYIWWTNLINSSPYVNKPSLETTHSLYPKFSTLHNYLSLIVNKFDKLEQKYFEPNKYVFDTNEEQDERKSERKS